MFPPEVRTLSRDHAGKRAAPSPAKLDPLAGLFLHRSTWSHPHEEVLRQAHHRRRRPLPRWLGRPPVVDHRGLLLEHLVPELTRDRRMSGGQAGPGLPPPNVAV